MPLWQPSRILICPAVLIKEDQVTCPAVVAGSPLLGEQVTESPTFVFVAAIFGQTTAALMAMGVVQARLVAVKKSGGICTTQFVPL